METETETETELAIVFLRMYMSLFSSSSLQSFRSCFCPSPQLLLTGRKTPVKLRTYSTASSLSIFRHVFLYHWPHLSCLHFSFVFFSVSRPFSVCLSVFLSVSVSGTVSVSLCVSVSLSVCVSVSSSAVQTLARHAIFCLFLDRLCML